jgi:hypothetical protein
MVYGSGPITKKIPKETVIKHHSEARFEVVPQGDFFNYAFKKSLLLCQECPVRKQLAYFHGGSLARLGAIGVTSSNVNF